MNQAELDPGSGALQASGIPAALIALTVKKTSEARLRMVVTMATKFASSLNRLKSRRTSALCKKFRQRQAGEEKRAESNQSQHGDIMVAHVKERIIENFVVHGVSL